MSDLIKFELIMPNVGVNDSEIKIVKIPFEKGSYVSQGEILFELESSKTIFDFVSEYEGYFYPLFRESEMPRVNSVIGVILNCKVDSPDILLKEYFIEDKKASNDSKVITAEASKLIESNGIDINQIDFEVITKDVVLEFLQSQKPFDIDSVLDRISIYEDSILVYGAGFQGKMILDALTSSKYKVACFVEANPRKVEYYGIPVIPIQFLDKIRNKGLLKAHIAIGNPKVKLDVCKILEENNFEIISIFHQNTSISHTAVIGKGVYLGPFVSIGPDAIIGDFCQINNSSSIAHDSKLGVGVMIADGCRIGGSVIIDDFSNLGINVSVNRDLVIGKRVNIISGVSIYSHISDDKFVKLLSNNLIIK
jgi:acetyltransferase-like isoleucine patch superfamily enzyme